MNKKTYLIEKAEKGLTIQQYLKQIAGFSNAQIRSMKFTENGICLGGQRARVTTRTVRRRCAGSFAGNKKQQLRTSTVL